jgi:hypothetical protein
MHIKLHYDGEKINLYVDGNLLIQMNIETPLWGTIGLRIKNTEPRFDWIVVK